MKDPIDEILAMKPSWTKNIQKFYSLEIHPCILIGDDSEGNPIVEQSCPEHAHFWRVFGHFRNGRLEDLEDFETEAEAVAFCKTLPVRSWSRIR